MAEDSNAGEQEYPQMCEQLTLGKSATNRNSRATTWRPNRSQGREDCGGWLETPSGIVTACPSFGV